MKKIILTLSIALCFHSAFALDPGSISLSVQSSHSKSLSYKTNSIGNSVYNAYYNANGDMVTAFRHILSTDLPMTLSFSLKKISNDMWVTDVVEVLNENKSTSYFVNLENANEKITLKSKNGKKWKIQKN
jgi:hypothetical protein